ncbi:MAG: type II secretion system protein [Betaproteobacteria bacterium]
MNEAGFSFVALLIIVAIVGLGLARVGPMVADQAQREREQALKETGEDVIRGIRSYYKSGAAQEYPRAWTDLLDDRRTPVVRRHLRRVPFDPITNSTEWDLIRDPSGGLIGVRSLSDKRPFAIADAAGRRIDRYRDWSFVYVPTFGQ